MICSRLHAHTERAGEGQDIVHRQVGAGPLGAYVALEMDRAGQFMDTAPADEDAIVDTAGRGPGRSPSAAFRPARARTADRRSRDRVPKILAAGVSRRLASARPGRKSWSGWAPRPASHPRSSLRRSACWETLKSSRRRHYGRGPAHLASGLLRQCATGTVTGSVHLLRGDAASSRRNVGRSEQRLA